MDNNIKEFVCKLLNDIKAILADNFIGFYIHGSLAMGGFNKQNSDFDILVAAEHALKAETKRKLAKLFLKRSKNPFPVEISFLNQNQLKNWQHPSPFDFHYSEFWRGRYHLDLKNGTEQFLNNKTMVDADLAAHITILNHRGICIEGPPIDTVFPSIPRDHYAASIMGDFKECLNSIEENPVYCVLNMIRVYRFLADGTISSKLEAGQWALEKLPSKYSRLIHEVMNHYSDVKKSLSLEKYELVLFKDYISKKVCDTSK